MAISKPTLKAERGLGNTAFRDTLKCSGLDGPEGELSDEQKARFDEARSMIERGKSYAQVAQHFGIEWTVKPKQQGRKDKKVLPSAPSDSSASEPAVSAALVASKDKNLTIAQLRELSVQKNHPLGFSELAGLIEVCGLPDRESYTAEQVAIFERGLRMLVDGKPFDEIRAEFTPDPLEAVDLLGLIEQAKQAGVQISFREAVKVFKVCGMSPDREAYSARERELFIAACRQHKNEGVSLERCASAAADLDRSIQPVLQANLRFMQLFTKEKAQAVASSVVPMFTASLAAELRDGSIIARDLATFEQAVREQLGKPQKSGIEIAREMGLLPDLTRPSESLLPASETISIASSDAE